MAGKFEAPRKKAGLGKILPLLLVALVAAGLLWSREGKQEDTLQATQPVSHSGESGQGSAGEEPPEVVSSAVISVQGDLLMHATFFQSQYNPVCDLGNGTYDFSSLFTHISPYLNQADLAVANLETTLGGDGFPYQGNPSFNCPDEILDAVKTAGYDLLLTANNHSYDTLMTGIDRTLEQVRNQGLETLGTRLSEEEPRYLIREINGIKIGMVCYTYTMTVSGGKPQLNDNSPVERPEQINWFSYNDLNGFYGEAEQIMAQMKAQGAEATMLFIHWGTEYETVENATQRAIAQKMCDIGFDVIVGGHPHVVQPMTLLSSNVDREHKSVCIYSLGNAVSNQRRDLMRLNTGHTEDGVLFTAEFEKKSDGSVSLADVRVIPTWVNLFERADGKREYNILPLDMEKRGQWMDNFGVTEAVYEELVSSCNRTMEILGGGLSQCREYLSQNR